MSKRSGKQSNRKKKQIVLFLLEGASEQVALMEAFENLYAMVDPNIEVESCLLQREDGQVGGDITSQYGVWKRNIANKIAENMVKPYLDVKKLYPKDILEIIQIVDLDGAYIPDEAITESAEYTGAYYGKDMIGIDNAGKIIKRNKQKRENLDEISNWDKILISRKNVTYSVYYFSCNLDHVLHGNANTPDNEKVDRAADFSAFNSKPDDFINFIRTHEDEMNDMTYEESWAFAKEGFHSLDKHTNIGILIEKITADR